MAQYQQDEFDYMVDDYEMADFNDDVERVHNRHRLDVDSESDDDFDAINKVTDTTAAQARRGKDIQGIHWDRLNFTRAKYRETRLQQYKNYENLPRRRHDLAKECKNFEKGCNFYDFRCNTRSVKSTIVHFQVNIQSKT